MHKRNDLQALYYTFYISMKIAYVRTGVRGGGPDQCVCTAYRGRGGVKNWQILRRYFMDGPLLNSYGNLKQPYCYWKSGVTHRWNKSESSLTVYMYFTMLVDLQFHHVIIICRRQKKYQGLHYDSLCHQSSQLSIIL